MPLTIPNLDIRRYEELRAEALRRIPVHTPEWTNFNESDPGVTLIEVFAFLTETLLYRANQIPERNRRKFLQLLGVPLRPASPARGLVAFANDRGPPETVTLGAGTEVRAESVPYRTQGGLDVLPVEARVFYKRIKTDVPQSLLDYYRQLYASYRLPEPGPDVRLYETVPFPPPDGKSVDLGREAVDRSLWIGLLVRSSDRGPTAKEAVRNEIGGRVLSLGTVPKLADAARRLAPGGTADGGDATTPRFEMPVGRTLPADRVPRYRLLEAAMTTDVLVNPGLAAITLPPGPDLTVWEDLDPLEAGVGDFPPAVEDTNLDARVITWIRLRIPTGVQAELLWAGINAAEVSQRARVLNERLPDGTGAPDQEAVLSKTSVLPDTLNLTVDGERWQAIDDLSAASAEVPVPDPRLPPGSPPPQGGPPTVFALDPEAGRIRFGNGLRGARPPFGAVIRVDYDYGVGRAGNVNAGSISGGPVLPAGFTVTNPVATWGGSEAETVAEAERQIARFLQHRDRLVTATDFQTIVRRTPGVDVGRVEVLPAFHPDLSPNEPGDAPGAVTLMVIPRYDSARPEAPQPDRLFLNAICRYVDDRRLVTTEVFLRGPRYRDIWVSIGLTVAPEVNFVDVREAVRRAVTRFLSPLPDPASGGNGGWPLRKPVVALELATVASRIPGVATVRDLLLGATDTSGSRPDIDMRGLDLPRLAGISVVAGDPIAIESLRGEVPSPPVSGPDGTEIGRLLPVPVVPEEC